MSVATSESFLMTLLVYLPPVPSPAQLPQSEYQPPMSCSDMFTRLPNRSTRPSNTSPARHCSEVDRLARLVSIPFSSIDAPHGFWTSGPFGATAPGAALFQPPPMTFS